MCLDSECDGDKLLFGWVVILCASEPCNRGGEVGPSRRSAFGEVRSFSLFFLSLVLTPH